MCNDRNTPGRKQGGNEETGRFRWADSMPRTITEVFEAVHSDHVEVADAAMNQLCIQYEPVISNYFKRQMKEPSDAKDRTQEFLITKFFANGDTSQSILLKYHRRPEFYPGEIKVPEKLNQRLANATTSGADPEAFALANLLRAIPSLSEPGADPADSVAEMIRKLNILIGGPDLSPGEEGAGTEGAMPVEAGASSRNLAWRNRRLLCKRFPEELPTREPLRFRQVLLKRMRWFLTSWYRDHARGKIVYVEPDFYDGIAHESDSQFDTDFAMSLLHQALSEFKEQVMVEYFLRRHAEPACPQKDFAVRLGLQVPHFTVRYHRFREKLQRRFFELVLERVDGDRRSASGELEHLQQFLPADLFKIDA